MEYSTNKLNHAAALLFCREALGVTRGELSRSLLGLPKPNKNRPRSKNHFDIQRTRDIIGRAHELALNIGKVEKGQKGLGLYRVECLARVLGIPQFVIVALLDLPQEATASVRFDKRGQIIQQI